MKIFISLLLIGFTNVSAECTNKDLTDPTYLKSVGKEKLINHFSKPRDQDSVGWCGAYASSDSLSYTVGEPVSAIDTSINFFSNSNYYKPNKLNELSSIFLDSAPTLAKSEGYCPESVLPSNKTLSTNLTSKNLSLLLSSFQSIYDSYVAQGRPSNFCVSCTPAYANNVKSFLPTATEKVIKEVLKKNQTESLSAFKDLLDKLCEGKRIKVDKSVVRLTRQTLGSKIFSNLIDDALDNDSMPSIGINSSYFVNPKYLQGGNFDHAMVVVAKRKNKDNKCEYLIRNSYGRGCIYYNNEIAKKCDPSKGTFWMAEEQLNIGVLEIMVVKNETTQPKPSNILIPTPLDNIEDLKDIETESNSNIVNKISESLSSTWKSFSKSFKYKGSK